MTKNAISGGYNNRTGKMERRHADGTVRVVTAPPSHGWLCDYRSGERIRPATAAEQGESQEQAEHDGGAGVITVDGVRCYVED